MKISDALITKGFIICGLLNMTVLVFSRFFTNQTIPKFDPVVMSNFGLLMIVVWGLAYMAIAKNFRSAKWLVGVFAVEKLIYGLAWIKWMMNNSVSEVYNEDAMAGGFYAIYGINDWLAFVFFTFVFIYLLQKKTAVYFASK